MQKKILAGLTTTSGQRPKPSGGHSIASGLASSASYGGIAEAAAAPRHAAVALVEPAGH